MSQEKTYKNAGFGGSVPRGPKPALIIVDFSFGFTDLAYPTASDASAQIAATNNMIAVARANSVPVIFTVISYNKAELGVLPWLKKATGMKALEEGSRLVEIDNRLDRKSEDAVIVKKGASGFFGTNLSPLLSGANVDTVVIAGATTSGCVRATAVDAVQSGFNVLVAIDACADRAQPPHDAALYDIQQKYGDTVTSSEVIQYLDSL